MAEELFRSVSLGKKKQKTKKKSQVTVWMNCVLRGPQQEGQCVHLKQNHEYLKKWDCIR